MNKKLFVRLLCALLSVLTLVDDHGVRGKINNWLTDEEVEKLQASANKLKSVIAQLDI